MLERLEDAADAVCDWAMDLEAWKAFLLIFAGVLFVSLLLASALYQILEMAK